MVLLSVTNISAVGKAMFALIPSFNPSQRMSVLELFSDFKNAPRFFVPLILSQPLFESNLNFP
jgi:hypothetical protein